MAGGVEYVTHDDANVPEIANASGSVVRVMVVNSATTNSTFWERDGGLVAGSILDPASTFLIRKQHEQDSMDYRDDTGGTETTR